MAMDGNCLFRSIALQAYGDAEFHMLVRDKCMNYISVSKDYFKDYISTDFETFEQYVSRKRRTGIWGDDVEL